MMAIGYLVMCLIFGTTYMAIKFGINDGMPPILMATLRFGIASVLLLAYYFLRRISFPKGWKTHAEIALLGVLMTTIPFTALFWAEKHITSGMAALLVATAPVCIGLFSKMDRWQWTGVGAALAGICLIVGPDLAGGGADSQSLWAKFGIVVAEFFFAWGAIRSKKVLAEVGASVFNGLQMFYASIGLLAVSLLTESPLSATFTSTSVWALLYLAVVASILASGIYYWLVQKTNPLFPTTWTYVAPIIALGAGALFLDEKVTLPAVIGALLVIGGVLVINRRIFQTLFSKKKATSLSA
ncbi:MAG: EamA family transporter [Tumebacillaceae bacterium]